MKKQLDPSLARIYGLADDEARIAYFDETYTGTNEDGRSFYAVTATIYRKKELEDLRSDLIDIVDDFFNKNTPYWHTTEALRTAEGVQKFKELLQYLSSNNDVSFITCQTPVHPKTDKQQSSKKLIGPEEDALWVPDIVGMAYRRRLIAPSSELGSWFNDYLCEHTRVHEFGPPQ